MSSVNSTEIVELHEDVSNSPLYSEDLAPVPKEKRTWTMWNLAAIWVGMAVCIPTYILASYMIKSGLSWSSALIIIALANLIITVPMVLNGHAGVKYGIPFPVLGRASFGTNGIHIASIVRGIVACGWFGVQTWIGGLAFYAIWNVITSGESSTGLDVGKFVCFGLFWLVNVFFIWNGTESIRKLEDFAAPILVLMGILLIVWGASKAGGFGIVLDQSRQLEKPVATLVYEKETDNFQLQINPILDINGNIKADHYHLIFDEKSGNTQEQWTQIVDKSKSPIIVNNFPEEIDKESILSGEKGILLELRLDNESGNVFSSQKEIKLTKTTESNFGGHLWNYILWLTAMVGFWATMSLSIADITRYASTQKAQLAGQFIGLPGTMILYSFVGIFVTCAAVINFKDVLIADDAPWDPVTLLSRFESPTVVIISQIFMLIATLSTNIAANVIAPANAFSNLFPKKLSFRGGGIVTAIIGIIICPWWILDEIQGLLIFVSGLLGPVLGVLLADYFVIRKKTLKLAELYKTNGSYAYGGSGFNSAAMIALGVGVVIGIIGMWVPALGFLYKLSWFTGFTVSFFLYWVLMKGKSE
ncbi:MAG: hypothetical protein COA57_07075 [Flavobacteriales bacterium]|nr:cytosine permease [Bacteroidales bacterium AH-315-I05]PCJ85871.1 MAG: hypothetical protein COA57_07075 [Flavobacteriales bacterium]